MEFERPYVLLWAVPLAVWLVFWQRRSLVAFTAGQRRVSLGLRGLGLAAILLALSGMSWVGSVSRPFTVLLVDTSQSIGTEGLSAARDFLASAERAQGGTAAALVTFAGTASDPRPLEPGRWEAAVAALPAAAPGGLAPRPPEEAAPASDLAAALDAAAVAIPAGYVPRIVLLSDGHATRGDAIAAANRHAIPVWTVPLPAPAEVEVQVTALEAPASVREGEPFHVEVRVDANRPSTGVLRLFRNAVELERKELPLKVGENRFRFLQSVRERFTEYAVVLEGYADTVADNNTASAVVVSTGKPRVLVLDSEPDAGQSFYWALRDQGIEVVQRPASGAPRSLGDLQPFEAVVLSNVPATALGPRGMEVLRTYVQQSGGGLLMLGGDQSFGLGGYYKTPIDELLPVRCDLEQEREKPTLAMVLAVDKSGSMGGQKLELVKEAARGAIELMSPRDQVGIVAFDGESHWISRLGGLNDKPQVLERISRIQPAGGTSIYPALDSAYEALKGTLAKIKHVIVLTDGQSTPGDFDRLVRSMATARITLSTVAVGSGADRQLLERLARLGGGRHYFCQDAQSVPQVFAKETMTASDSALDEAPFLPRQMRATPVLDALRMDEVPFLLGHVVTQAKPTCELILTTETGQPLLAWWRSGLGRVAAFTSDAKPRWAAEWLSWSDFGKFWAQVTRHIMRRDQLRGSQWQVRQQGELAHASLDLVDDQSGWRNEARPRLSIVTPDGLARQLELPQTAPGRYEVSFATPLPGHYQLTLGVAGAGLAGEGRQQGQRTLSVGYPEEFRVRPPDLATLRQLASQTGGRFAPAPDEVFRADRRRVEVLLPLWPQLLAAAVLLLVADVFVRRVELSRWFRPVSPPISTPSPSS